MIDNNFVGNAIYKDEGHFDIILNYLYGRKHNNILEVENAYILNYLYGRKRRIKADINSL